MATYTISQATTNDDIEEISTFIGRAYAEKVEQALETDWYNLAKAEFDAAQAAIAASQTPDSVWLIAKTDIGAIIGAAVFGKSNEAPFIKTSNSLSAWLIWVKRGHRRKGVEGLLHGEAVQWAIDNGYSGLIGLFSESSNTASHSMAVSNKWTKLGLVFFLKTEA